ncbi:SusC/RagA family TonB-linked outer membrane protein [Chryseobacterium vrystaatense]|uniref:TonB-dependent Receptor Plug Domain n=1 Tax=Chryseobacterium vrystaatense TaxID=307480 RepID=A0A1M5L490_9FLAO|nr:SusC/RagA family TonB-linked outer membrane protein [Chryseobacterium vrystaatense]SHG59902.1 TonB-dependent Receptor Plug Domain [Chryseobacterium vrystaatense]
MRRIKLPLALAALWVSDIAFAQKTGEQENKIDEVVVIGYGSKKIKDVTGAVTNLKASDANIGGATTNIDQMIGGRVAGIQFKQTSDQPGGGSQTIIRGRNSIFGATDPLYIIDGIPLSEENTAANGSSLNGAANFSAPSKNPLNSINPNDIESIAVLKDASATAIYGSRGANGVIIITTKRGKTGKAKITYDTYYSWQNAIKNYDIMDSQEYVNFWTEMGKTLNSVDTSIHTDWQKQIQRTGIINSHALSMSGGGDNIKYFASLGYFDQEGILKNSGIERYTGRLNLNYTKNKLAINTNIFTSYIKDKNPAIQGDTRNSLVSSAITFAPYLSADHPNLSDPFSDFNVNPLLFLNIKDRTKSDKLNASTDISYEILDGLKPQLKFGYETQNSVNNFFLPNSVPASGMSSIGVHGGIASNSNARNNNYLVEALLNYNKTFGKHQIIGLAGYSIQKFDNELTIAYGEKFPTDILDGNYNLQSASILRSFSNKVPNTLISGFGRIDYTYDGKYSLTASIRRDGSSKFSTGNKWGWFPGASAAWKISEEEFLKDNKTINELKLRAGYGKTGNQGFNNYLSLNTYLVERNGILGQQLISGATLANYTGNKNFKWETTTQFNLGIDFQVFNRVLSGSIDVFNKKTKDLVIPISLPFESGVTQQWINAADTKTNGIEVSLEARIIRKKHLSWNANANFSSIKTTVDKIYGGTSAKSAMDLLGFREGERANAYLAPTFLGLNPDGSMNLSSELQYQGTPDPKFTAGFGNNFKYRNFGLDVFFTASLGQKLFNYAAAQYGIAKPEQPYNLLKDAQYFRAVNGAPASRSGSNYWAYNSHFIEDASFVRLQNITLSYDLPAQQFFGDFISSFKLYFQAQNVWTWTKYSGLNPESSNISYLERSEGIPTPMLPGKIDLGGYPSARTYSLGVNISF